MGDKERKATVAISIAGALLAVTMPAQGWNQSTTDSGAPIDWNQSCIYWTMVEQEIDNTEHFDDPVQPLLSYEELRGTVRGAFSTWEEVDCSYFTFVETEPGQCLDVGFHNSSGNANRVFFRTEGWVDPNATWRDPVQIALTSVFFDTVTGDILDVDIEINAEYFELTTTLEDPRTDIQNALTHEVGHLLGLDHSDERDATMYRSAAEGETSKRDLSTDDIAGLCEIYPMARDPGGCSEPRGGLDLQCESADSCSESEDGLIDDCAFPELICCCDQAGGLGACDWRDGGACSTSGGNIIYQIDELTACGESPGRGYLCCCQTDLIEESSTENPRYSTTCSWERSCQTPETVPAIDVYNTVLCGRRPVAEGSCQCQAAGRPTSQVGALSRLLTAWLL